jgi:AraC-like DNA-binding protein
MLCNANNTKHVTMWRQEGFFVWICSWQEGIKGIPKYLDQKIMNSEKFFKDIRLPFVECRSSRSSVREFKAHMHKSFCIGAVELGRVQYSVGEREAVLTTGCLAVINPESLHACNSLGSEGRSFSMLYLDVGWCLEVQKSLWNVDSFVPAEDIRLDDLELYRRYCGVVQHLLDSTVHLLEKEQLLVELSSVVFSRACRVQALRQVVPENIERLKILLGENLKEDITLEPLARQLGVNPYTLLRRFKAVTGITPHAYRMNCRVEQARKYLQEGMDIAETALECGFFDQSHFHRHFKAMTTCTPQEYRVNFVQ